MLNKKLPHRLKNLREEKGYLQKYVAGEIGVKNNTLSGYENGLRSPDPDMIVELARLYDVTTDYLLGNNDDPYKLEYEELEELIEDMRNWYNNQSKEKTEKLNTFKKIFYALVEEETESAKYKTPKR